MKKLAKPIAKVKGMRGDARVYRLTPPMVYQEDPDDEAQTHYYVLVSAVDVPYSGPETYIFPCNPDTGEVTDWGELPGSFRGDTDHERALRNAGYKIDY